LNEYKVAWLLLVVQWLHVVWQEYVPHAIWFVDAQAGACSAFLLLNASVMITYVQQITDLDTGVAVIMQQEYGHRAWIDRVATAFARFFAGVQRYRCKLVHSRLCAHELLYTQQNSLEQHTIRIRYVHCLDWELLLHLRLLFGLLDLCEATTRTHIRMHFCQLIFEYFAELTSDATSATLLQHELFTLCACMQW